MRNFLAVVSAVCYFRFFRFCSPFFAKVCLFAFAILRAAKEAKKPQFEVEKGMGIKLFYKHSR